MGPELAFDLEKVRQERQQKLQQSYKIQRKNSYKKYKKLEKKIKKVVKLSFGIVFITTALASVKGLAGEVSEVEAEEIVNVMPINDIKIDIVDQESFKEDYYKVVHTANSKPMKQEVHNNLLEESYTTYDFSYEKRMEDFATRNFNITPAVEKLMTEEVLNCASKYSYDYGFDPYLIVALYMRESSLDQNNMGNKNAIGIGQIEKVNIGSTISAQNYNTGETDYLTLEEDKLYTLEGNVKASCMMFSKRLSIYDDLCISYQSYNYSPSSMNLIIRVSKLENPTYQELLPIIKDYHENPAKYLGDKYLGCTYGDDMYPQNVLQYFPGNVTYYSIDPYTLRLYNVDKNEKIGDYNLIFKAADGLILEEVNTHERIKIKNANVVIKEKENTNYSNMEEIEVYSK